MDAKLQVVEDCANAFSGLVKMFQHLANDNQPLRDLLEGLHSTLARRHRRIPVDSNTVASSAKKRKLNSASDVDLSNGDDSLPRSSTATLIEQKHSAQPHKSAQEQVFGIPLVLEAIFANLNTSDLKSCRSVNRASNSEAANILIKRQALTIKFDLDSSNTETESVGLPSKDSDYHQSNEINALSDLLENSKELKFTFPCKYFVFVNGNITNADLLIFLSRHGSLVQDLHIDISVISPERSSLEQFKMLSILRKLLTTDLPNMKALEIGAPPNLWNEEDDLGQLFPDPVAASSNPVTLSKLKSLKFSFCESMPKKIFNDMITCASQLENIGLGKDVGIPVHKTIIDTLKTSTKIYLLTSLEFEIDVQNVEFFRDLASEELHLKDLIIDVNADYSQSVDEFKASAAEVVLSLLNSCSGTLVKLHTSLLGVNSQDEIPIMPKLKRIRSLNGDGICRKAFPNGLKLSKVFPILESYESKFVPTENEETTSSSWVWEEVFGADDKDKNPSVKELNFSCGSPDVWIQNFSQMFQNLTTVRVGLIEDFPKVSKMLWKMKRLEKLEFIIDPALNEYPGIDMGFTGFSESYCMQLFQNSRTWDVSKSELRVHPSILDAKCLRKLNLIIFDSATSTRINKTFQCISHVTGLFAFKMCPQLNVKLIFGAKEEKNNESLKNALSPILPYISYFTHFSRSREPVEDWTCLKWHK